MATEWISPTWRMPEESNQSKFENYSLDFDGTQYIDCGAISPIPSATELTVSCWLKADSITTNQVVWADDSSSYIFSFEFAGTVNKMYFEYAPGYAAIDLNSVITVGSWHNVVMVYDANGAANTDKIKFYIDGVDKSSSMTYTGAIPSSLSASIGKFLIGYGTAYNKYFDGSLTELSIFDSALSSAQITALYNSGTPVNPMALTPLPVAYYPLGGSSTGSATTLTVPNESVPSATVFDFDSSSLDPSVTVTDLGISDEFSVSVWTNVDTITSFRGALGATSGGGWTDGFGMYINASKWVFFVDHYNTGKVTSSTTITTGTWIHLVGTFSSSGTGKLYVNGTEEGTPVTGKTLDGLSNNFGIGSIFGGGGPYQGMLSNIQIWNKELIASEVTTLYNNGVPLLTGTQPQASNLKGWWKMNVDTSTWGGINWSITDSSGEGNTATSSGMTTANLVNSDLTRSIPYSSYSMVLDGTADFINCGNAFTQTGAFSVSAWIKTSTTSATSVFYKSGVFQFGKDNWYNIGVGNAPNLSLTDSGGITKLFRNGVAPSGATVTVGTFVDLKDGNWHHIAFTYDGTNQGKYYTDGLMTYTYDITDASWAGTLASNSNDLLIGKTTVANWNGNISNASFFSSSLTEDQILTIYNGGVPNDISSLSPVGWWSLAGDSYFNGSDWICPDLGSGGNNGTSANMAGTELVGNGPGSTSNGVATSMDIPANLKGNAPNSTNNAFSVNMNSADRVSDVPS